jgi:hypothetical protein
VHFLIEPRTRHAEGFGVHRRHASIISPSSDLSIGQSNLLRDRFNRRRFTVVQAVAQAG